MDTTMHRVRLTYLQEKFSSALKSIVLKMANNEPLIIGSLPSDIQRRFHDENHQLFRINIYLDKDVSNHVSLLDELSSDDINITGLFVIFKELQNKLIKNGPYIFTYLIIIILGSFFIYSHSMKNILIIIISLIIAFAWFLGSLSLLDIPLNLINIYIIPVILLVGIYFGMQIILQLNKGINIDLVGYIIRIFIALSLMGIILFFIFPIEYKVNSINIFHILFLGLMSNYFIHSIIPILLVRSSK